MKLTQYKSSDNQKKIFDNLYLWNVSEVARYLKLSIGTIYNKVSAKSIPYYKKGKRLYFLPDEILNWIQEGNYE